MAKPLKVSVTVKLEIDPEAWGMEYGFDPKDTAAIREDVKNYVGGAIRDHLGGMEVLAR